MKQSQESIAVKGVKAVKQPKTAIEISKGWLRDIQRPLDQRTTVHQIAELFDREPLEVHHHFREAVLVAESVYAEQLQSWLPRFSSANVYRILAGAEKFAREDRLAQFIIVRLLQPDLVVETGVKWGEGALFLTEALKLNGSGKLVSFDVGFDDSQTTYEYPPQADQVGFLVPEENREYWELVIGDSITRMETELPQLPPVDFFYHDSLHTYDHMLGEFETVLHYMSSVGALMSEDIDQNTAWDDFVEENRERFSHTTTFSFTEENTKRGMGAAVMNP